MVAQGRIIALLLLVTLLVTACGEQGVGGNATSEPQAPTPQESMVGLTSALEQDDTRFALTFVAESAQDQYSRYFSKLEQVNRLARFGRDLASLTLVSQTDREARFNGILTVNTKRFNTTYIFVPGRNGVWLLYDMRGEQIP